jgi:monovalent cation/hydrogen antiporter
MLASLEVWTGLLGIVVLVTFIAQRFYAPAPVLLVPVGLALSVVPGLPAVTLHPDLVLNALLPLLVYTSAVVIPWRTFRHNLRPIGLLSVGLVLFTTAGVALLGRFLFPSLPWGVLVVLGAIISPPDDVAVAVVASRLPIPRRILTILEGEGLVNDVTALTLFRYALVATAGGAISAWQVSLFFLVTLLGGILYGLAIGWLALQIRRRLHDTNLEITVSLITPFVAYLLPERLGVTGILSVVVAGIVVSAQSPRMIPAITRLRVHDLWRIVAFWLNGLLFLLLGLQMRDVSHAALGLPLSRLLLAGFGFSLLVIVLRFVWVYPVAYLSRLLIPSLRRSDPLPPPRHLFLLAYTGMRGAISLAAALAIPLSLPGGGPFPGRNLVVFITFCVILVTLVGQGLFLPLVVRLLRLAREGTRERRQESRLELETMIALARAGIRRLDALAHHQAIPAELLATLREERKSYIDELERHVGGHRHETPQRLAGLDLKLQYIEIQAERQKLMQLLEAGRIDDETLVRAERDLDLREARLQEHVFPFTGTLGDLTDELAAEAGGRAEEGNE